MALKSFIASLIFAVVFAVFTSTTFASGYDKWLKANGNGIKYAEDGNFDKAIKTFNQALKIAEGKKFPAFVSSDAYDDAEDVSLINLGSTYLKMGDTAKAFEYLNGVVEKSPTCARAWNMLGVARYHTGDYDKAVESFKKALTLEPKYFDALKNLKTLYLKTNNEDAKTWHELGSSFNDIGQHKDALKCFVKVTELLPDNAVVWKNAGVVSCSLKDYDGAIRFFDRALEINPEYFSAIDLIGKTYFNVQNYDEALKYLQRAVALKPDSVSAVENLADVYVKVGDNDKAIECFRKAVELNAKSATAWHGLSKIYFESGDYENAIACGEKAVALDENYGDAWTNLGKAYSAMSEVCSEKSKAYEFAGKAAVCAANAHHAARHSLAEAISFGVDPRQLDNFLVLGSVIDG